jgi:hypothetical protein
MTLYNCRHDGDQYRISKFDEDMNVESSYLCTTTECECPAGHRKTCRHRQMLPYFISREAQLGPGWFYDYDRGGWVQPFDEMPPLPRGVTLLSLNDPTLVHNTLAEALGESPLPQGSSVVEQRTHNPPVAGSIPAPATSFSTPCPQCGGDMLPGAGALADAYTCIECSYTPYTRPSRWNRR